MQNKWIPLLFTQGISLIGSRMTAIAIGIWLYETTGKATYLLLVPFFTEMPMLMAGYLGGIIIDRWGRKKILILGDFGQAVGSILLLLSILSGHFQPWMLYSVAFMQGVFTMIQEPAIDATFPLLVPERELDKVNGVKEMLFPFAGIVSPILTGILYSMFGITGVILIDFIYL
ncbi:MFS transporter [Chengkuizengella axinellae]|uniref:MFS transporter n=1 Tax=Chengkuizengella axinellae TaxID=3064388 RepID=A0ABT9IWH1_9BACL|nr:MFS transporter [Chengkuizengella sp. 2205SS18-9]MDP5273713.1 MFS transporter [Chengkuizengella sp. 2205SS18-9]